MAQKYKNKDKPSQLDQFYTNTDVAKKCFSYILEEVAVECRETFLEPSAGDGSFSNLIINDGYKCLAFDLDPKQDYIKKMDFLKVSKEQVNVDFNNLCVVGNPPFGKNSSLAVKFFNKCSELAGTICFVVPKTFKKQSIHNRLNLNFHLIKSIDLSKNSFVFNGEKYNVPCVFQIWKWKKTKRKVIKSKTKCAWFKFVSKEKANFAVRRVGGRAGKAFLETNELSKQSNHFCKTIGKVNPKDVVELINKIDFKTLVNSTAGVRSLSKGELLRLVKKEIKK